jgi:hypothetical protein
MSKSKKITEEELLLSNYRAVLKSGSGREVIWDILSMCDIYSPVGTKFTAGKRQVGLDLLRKLQDVHPTTYAQLQLTMLEQENA